MNREEPLSRLKLLEWVTAALLIVIALNRLSTTVADPDMWGYLAFGWLIWSQGQFPYRDVFAYAPTVDMWIHHDWLTGTLFFPLYQVFGFPALQVIKYATALFTLRLIYSTATRRGANPLVSALVLFLILQGWFTFGYSPVRAQIFTYFFFALTLYLLERTRLDSHWKRLWFLIPILVFWCNMHGGFLAGLGLIFLYALTAFVRRQTYSYYMLFFFLSTAATLINPYGPKYWNFVVMSANMPRPELWEWASLPVAYLSGNISWAEVIHLLAMVVLGAVALMKNRWRDTVACIVLVITLFIGLKSIRHLVFFYIAAGAYLPSLLMYYYESSKTDLGGFACLWNKIHINAVIAGAAMITLIIALNFLNGSPFHLKIPSGPHSGIGGTSLYYPVGAAEHIKMHKMSGNLLVEYEWGAYLFWTLYPQCRVSLDPRYETVYPEEVSRKYFDFIAARPNYRQFLNDYPPAMILIPPFHPIYELIKREGEWQEIYTDAGSALFKKRK